MRLQYHFLAMKIEPSPKAHIHSDLIVNKHTEQVKKLHMDLSWHALNSYVKGKNSLSHWKARIWLTVAFKRVVKCLGFCHELVHPWSEVRLRELSTRHSWTEPSSR